MGERSDQEKSAYIPVAQVFTWICLFDRHHFSTASGDNVKCPKCGNWEFISPISLVIHFVWRLPTGGEP